MKANSLCWKCKNFTKCSWVNGIPVEGWEAIPTTIESGKNEPMKSYIVLKCPQFEEDDMFEISLREIAEMTKTPYDSDLCSYRGNLDKINKKLEPLGYKLLRKNKWYLWRLDAIKKQTTSICIDE